MENPEALHMNPQTSSKSVHESQTQRQHVRVSLPGVVDFSAGDERLRCKLCDVSAGGLSFATGGKHHFRVGENFRGGLTFNVDGIAIALSVSFQVRNLDSGRIGCAFLELGQREISALRHLISSHLAGDLTTVGDMLHTIGRDNFTKPRPAAAGSVARASSQLRALVMTLCFTLAGAMAFTYTARHLSKLIFVTEATAAKVTGSVYTIEMPREGTFHSLVPPDGMVKRGAAIASFDSPVIDLLRSQALGPNMSIEQLQKMMGVTIKGTITSPCDCRVQSRFVADEQYVARGQPVMDLMPVELQPYVIARFRSDQAHEIEEGSVVHFRVNGDGETRSGRIQQIRAAGHGDAVDSDVLATIEPVDPIPAELFSRPAVVTSGEMPTLADLSLLLGGPANAAEPPRPGSARK